MVYATYQQLLERWRFAPIGDPMFQGETGNYFAGAIKRKKAEVENWEPMNELDEMRQQLRQTEAWLYFAQMGFLLDTQHTKNATANDAFEYLFKKISHDIECRRRGDVHHL